MALISLQDLHPTGADFFTDSESYLHELSETELSQQGGIRWITTSVTDILYTLTVATL